MHRYLSHMLLCPAQVLQVMTCLCFLFMVMMLAAPNIVPVLHGEHDPAAVPCCECDFMGGA